MSASRIAVTTAAAAAAASSTPLSASTAVLTASAASAASASSKAHAAQLTAVQQYLTQFGIEQHVSNAVNMAIKQNSDDPFRIISDYLRKLAKDQDASAEDDEVTDEHEELLLSEKRMAGVRGSCRRPAVNVPVPNVPVGWSPPVHDKPQAAKEFLKGALSCNRLMKTLTPSDHDALVLAFELKTFADGKQLTRQGERANTFYILEAGVADISIMGKGSVMKATRGVAFGELALIQGAPSPATSAATVTAESKVSAWALDEAAFKTILMNKAQQDAHDYARFLTNVPILQHCIERGDLEEAQLLELARCLREVEYPAGRVILAEGDEGNHFFLVRSGEVKCTQGPESKVQGKHLGRGDFFGELALLSTDQRAATVTAVQPTQVLMISRSEFTSMLGSLSDMITSGGRI